LQNLTLTTNHSEEMTMFDKKSKGKLSPILYMIAIAISFWAQWISQGLFILVALIWLVPDRRIEKALVDN